MRKNTILINDDFKSIIQYKPIVSDNDSESRNKIKMDMLDSIISTITIDKWQRMKSSVKSCLEYMTFLSIERGFSWIAPETVAERYSVNPATIRRYISYLAKMGIISRLWRASSKRNSRGCVCCFFHSHPYFERYWHDKFFMHENARNEVKNESIKNAESTKENDRFPVSTISSPDFKDLSTNKRQDLNYFPQKVSVFGK